MTQTLTLFLGGILLAGCTLPPVQPRPGPGHPGSFDAAEAPMPARSDTLTIDDATTPQAASPAEMKPEMNMKSMGGMKHDMGGMPGMPGMQHQNMEGMKHDTPAAKPGENAAPSAPRWSPATAPATKATSPAPADHAGHGGTP